MPIQFTGVDAAIRAMKKIVEGDVINIVEGLPKVAQVVLRKSQQYCPVDKGPLLASGRVEEVTGKGNGAEVIVVYGGPTAPYALIVHERPATHAPPTCYKFLERAARETKGTQTTIMKRQMKATIGRRE